MKKIKHIFSILLAFAVILPATAQSVPAGSKITVGTPAFQNGGEADTWVPIYVQGQLTTDFQNYSGLTVIDRQAARQLMEEQKIKEQNAYIAGSEDEIQYAALVDADYLVSVMLIKTGSSFSLQCSIQSVKSSSLVGKVYSAPNLSETDLSSGSAVHKASYELLSGIGVPEDSLFMLKDNSNKQQAETAANVFTAKGMAVEQQGGSIVQAMAYYQKAVGSSSAITEAASRLDGLTSQISGVNLGETAMKDMKLRKQWQKIWEDMIAYTKDYWADVAYDPSLLDFKNPNYEKGTIDLVLPITARLNPEVKDLWIRLIDAYVKTPKQGDWKLDNFYDWGDVQKRIKPEIAMAIYNSDDVCIGHAKATYNLSWCDGSIGFFWGVKELRAEKVNPELITDSLSVKVETNSPGGRVRAMQSKKL
ncbi:MAG: hypothetical protein IJ828_10655 [Treponema sp.]|nr:hypothetical protein [Treponema sp.]